jgi:PDZ domain
MHARLIAMICATMVAATASALAQTAVPQSQLQPPTGALSHGRNGERGASSDAALEVAPHIAGPPAAEPSPAAIPDDSVNPLNSREQELPPVPTSGPPASMVSNDSRQQLPYLGVAVQQIASQSRMGRDVDGLEIVSIDPDSPAQRAGLKARGGMTTLGASGATAGALMAPLDIALMPILKKTGQLGHAGDLIVAIDDRRVAGEQDLETALAHSRAGDTIYLTVVRLSGDSAHKTIKIPVKLGAQTTLR